MITKGSTNCMYCNKKFSVRGNRFNQWLIDDWISILCVLHNMSNHPGKQVKMRLRKLIKLSVSFLVGIVIQIFAIVLWIVTLPFWAIHELVD